jgi:D-amino-acid dehydrogenase
MPAEVLVLGAGMVGTCTALQLQRRGCTVTLVDRRAPGRETSYGNAGMIQREAVEPYAFPRDARSIFDLLRRRGAAVHWHASALPRIAPALWRYFRHSAPAPHARATQAFSRLIAHCLDEHQALLSLSAADDLVRREGFRFVYRSTAAFDRAASDAQRLTDAFGVRHAILDTHALSAAEPALWTDRLAGAIHWLDPWSISDPGELVARHANAFMQAGGRIVQGDAFTLQQASSAGSSATRWRVQTTEGAVDAAQAVVALGPWSDALVRGLGYRFPLFVKRGYHQHYRPASSQAGLRLAFLDAERGYVLVPMRQGWRLTTGAEFARIDAAATPVQLARAEAAARELVDLPPAAAEPPWLGARPCIADMLPVMGAAPRHRGLWFNFAHAHQGFTLGPVAGRLLAELITGEPPLVDPTPYAPARFG